MLDSQGGVVHDAALMRDVPEGSWMENRPEHFASGERPDEIREMVVGPIDTNCYAYVSAGECLVVDPGDWGDQIAAQLTDVHVVLIAATHGHGDHVGGVARLKEATGAPYAIAEADAERATHAGQVAESGRSYDDDAPWPDRYLADGDELRVGTATFRVIATPGHTPGGVCLLGGDSALGVCFVGDTLFPSSHGRTDFSGGDEEEILESLQRMAREIPPATVLLCGHGPATTMERELRDNPFLQGA